MTDYLASVKDPRLGYLYDTTGGKTTGNFLGDFSNAKPVSQLGTIGRGILKSASMPGTIMPAFESFFLQSEAAYRGLISGDYVALFKQALTEDFRFLGIPNPAGTVTSFLQANQGNQTVDPNAGNFLKALFYQKWVALAEVDGLEAWSEWRRSGYPDRTNPSVAQGVNVNRIPERLLYPQSEYNLNSKNVNAQNQTIADIYTPIFWAQ